MITPVPMPPMLARRQPAYVAAFVPTIKAGDVLAGQLAALDWLCANDPDEPKVGAGWWA